MSFKFPSDNDAASRAGHDWVVGATELSFSVWARMDDERSPAYDQYVFNLFGSTGEFFGLRWDDDSNIKAMAYMDGVWRSVTGGAWTEDTIYHIAGTWKANDANGWKLYVNGTLQNTVSTSGQASFDGGAVTLWLSAWKSGSNFGRSSIEALVIVRDHILSQEEVTELYHGADPAALPLAAEEYVYYPLDGDFLLTRAPDRSPKALHFEAAGIVDAEDGGVLRPRVEDPWAEDGGPGAAVDAGTPPTPPGAWTYAGEVTHPTAEMVISGLTNGQSYDFKVVAVDAAGNVSADSAIDAATPMAMAKHVTRGVLLFTR